MSQSKDKDWLNGNKNKTLQEIHIKLGETYRLKVRGCRKILHANGEKKKAGVAILTSDKIDIKTKTIIRDKEGHYIMINEPTQEEDIAIINIYASNIEESQCIRQVLTTNKGEIDSITIMSSIQLFSDIRPFATPWTAACRLPYPLPTPTQTHELVMPSNHLVLCCPLLIPPSIIPSIRVFSNESVLHIKWPKYWSISQSNEYSGLISFSRYCLDILAAQGTLKSLLQNLSSKTLILQCSHFLIVQISHP